ncbi:MAG: helix-turn-helix domain-containing protein [Lachnospiraceae bacterium]|nr:helix-turn-helix domain-containing protein [Lachnospiraceae bacterium]
MISNQILQTTIEGLKNIARIDFCITDTEGKALASTFEAIEIDEADVLAFVSSPADSQEIQGYQFFKVYDDDDQLEYALIASGGTDDVYTIGKIAAYQLTNLLVAYKERFDKDNFVKNLLLDNLLLVDIFNRAKKLHIGTDVKRVVMIAETFAETNTVALEKIREEFNTDTHDFVTAVDEKDVIIIKELTTKKEVEEIERTAKAIMQLFPSTGRGRVRVAYGTRVDEIKDVSRSYKEARMALDVGKIFFGDKPIISYDQLGIGRIIYQLPIPLCKMFIKEIFKSKAPEQFDEETITTIDKFFENSLNVSETSRQLYIHRNTLVYRLDKLQKQTGLDLRIFEDAITFKIALMVARYMKYMEDYDF